VIELIYVLSDVQDVEEGKPMRQREYMLRTGAIPHLIETKNEAAAMC
jgi:hypothetical protein